MDIQSLYEKKYSDGSYVYSVADIARRLDILPDTLRKTIQNAPYYVCPRKVGKAPDLIANDWNAIIEAIRSTAIPVNVDRSEPVPSDSYLLIPLNDLHMGSMTFDDYRDTQDRILDLIDEGHKEIIIWLGGDLFDTDNLRGTTSRGTYIGKTDWPTAWGDLSKLVLPIIAAAYKKSKVEVIMSRGNHSESMEWAFCQYLKAAFPKVPIDDGLDYIKARLLGNTFLGFSHGNKRMDNLAVNLSKIYRQLWGEASHYEMIVGHEHKEYKVDGILLRRMPSPAIPNEWSEEEMFAIEHQCLMCLQYGEHGVESVRYV